MARGMMKSVRVKCILLLKVLVVHLLLSAAQAEGGCSQFGGEGYSEPQTTACPYVVLSLRTYFYVPSEIFEFWLMPIRNGNTVGVYSLEIVDADGAPQGVFVRGDSVCEGGSRITHREVIPQTRARFQWQAPAEDMGTLYIKFEAGIDKTTYWKHCSSIPLKITDHLPSPLPVTRPVASSVTPVDYPVGSGKSWCHPAFYSPVYQPVIGTNCRSYREIHIETQVSEILQCPDDLVFSTMLCTCSYPNRSKCFIP